MPPEYWLALADDYRAAYRRKFNRAPSKSAVVIPMCIAEFETQNGRSWPGTNNFGATQLSRGQVPIDLWARKDSLAAGTRFPGNPGGVLHIDTHPTASGPEKYAAWFAAFDQRVDGIAFFLAALWRISKGAPDAPDATCTSVATGQYLGGYFEGGHAGARPVAKRSIPLTPPEQANVDDYARALDRIRPTIQTALADWIADPAGLADLAHVAIQTTPIAEEPPDDVA